MVASEGDIVRDMSADIMQLMTLIGLLIALAVVALTLFTATLSKLREYAVLKALGARPARLIGTVLGQALWYVALAVGLAVAVTVLISQVLAALSPTVRLALEPSAVLRLTLGTVSVAAVASVLPLQRVLRLDPASAFRRPT
jgi:putative ABC transport system permease protein